MSDHWGRALLRAELLERGLDAVGSADLSTALLHPAFEEGRGPVRAILIDDDVLATSAAAMVALLASRNRQPAVVLLASTQLAEPRGPWSLVVRRPAAIGEIATTLEQLARRTGSSTGSRAASHDYGRGDAA